MAVLYRREDRADETSMIPPRIWSDLLLLGFRLLTNIRNFSFCEHHADYSPDRPETVMDRVLADLQDFNSRLHVELFGNQDRNRTLVQACEDLLAEVTGRLFAPGQRGGDGENASLTKG
jgi:hypothetical protein